MNLDGLEPHWMWLSAAALMAIAELLLPGVFLIWLSAAAALTGFAALLFGIPLAFQFALFALLALAATYSGRRWYADHPVASSDPLLNDRAARLIGQTLVVVTAIENGTGRVRVGDSVWNARGPDVGVGERVRVMGAEGTCLQVVPVEAGTLPASSAPIPPQAGL